MPDTRYNKFCTHHARMRFAQRYKERAYLQWQDWEAAVQNIKRRRAKFLGTDSNGEDWLVNLGGHNVIAVYRGGRIITLKHPEA